MFVAPTLLISLPVGTPFPSKLLAKKIVLVTLVFKVPPLLEWLITPAAAAPVFL